LILEWYSRYGLVHVLLYGSQLRYRESMTTGWGVRGARAAGGLLMGLPLVMLSQTGLCLAFDTDQLPSVAGVLTPATATGAALIARLNAENQTYCASVA
jgi:short subunit dehydrogenase-like uncharacterized protein